uniref:Uncharacterized protein n=1 Tax=Panagrolaimus sp. PS1159 TaxID=55785 RepID=A0AC35FAY4_9BILA
MFKASIKAYPPLPPSSKNQYKVEGDRSKVGTTVASYLDTFHPEHYHQTSTQNNAIQNNGFVSKQRNFFSQQTATPISIDSFSSSSSSAPEDSEESGNSFSNVKEKKNDYLEKLSKVNNSSRRKSAPHGSEAVVSPAPKVTITGVTAIDPPLPSELPTSFYLLRQSQESLILKRKPRATSENPAERDRSPSYRTIIKFSKNREIIPDSSTSDRPFPHSVLKPGEGIIHSTPFVEVSNAKN